MKCILIINLITMSFFATNGLNAQSTNDFYDDAETFELKGKTKIEIAGEVGNPGIIDITSLELRSLVIKEALLYGDSNRFIGAYRYDGYSLYDILNFFNLRKKMKRNFPRSSICM